MYFCSLLPNALSGHRPFECSLKPTGVANNSYRVYTFWDGLS